MKVFIIQRLFYKVLTVSRPVLENVSAMNGVRYIAMSAMYGFECMVKVYI